MLFELLGSRKHFFKKKSLMNTYPDLEENINNEGARTNIKFAFLNND